MKGAGYTLGRLKVQLADLIEEVKSSPTMKVLIMSLLVCLVFAAVYAFYEDVSYFEAFFVSLIGIMSEYGADPQTTGGKASMFMVMVAGLVLLAVLIGEISQRFLERLLHRGRIKVKKRSWNNGHVVLLGASPKLAGVLR